MCYIRYEFGELPVFSLAIYLTWRWVTALPWRRCLSGSGWKSMNPLFLANHKQWLMRMSRAGVFVCSERWFGENEARLEFEEPTW
jgi:hypothetical protein